MIGIERMRGTGRKRRLRGLIGAGALLLAAAALAAGCGGKGSGHGHPKNYRELNKAFQPLRKDFEIESGKVRVVALVSPSCGRCVEAAEDISNVLLHRIKSKDLVVLMVWTSIYPPDVAPKVKTLAERYIDPRMVHYWDDSGRIARIFGRHLGVEPGLSVNDIIYVYGRNDTWDPNGTMASEPPNQNALIAGWALTAPRYRMGYDRQVRMPEFDVDALTREVEELLAESDGSPGAASAGPG